MPLALHERKKEELNLNTWCTTNTEWANPAHTDAQNKRSAFVCLMETRAAGICFANDGDVECDAVCCLIIRVCVCVSLYRFLLRYLPHHSRHDVFLSDDGRA